MYMKWFLIALVVSCSATQKIKERHVKDRIVAISPRDDGACNYIVEPKHNYRLAIKDSCFKYEIDDSLTRIETYTMEEK